MTERLDRGRGSGKEVLAIALSFSTAREGVRNNYHSLMETGNSGRMGERNDEGGGKRNRNKQ